MLAVWNRPLLRLVWSLLVFATVLATLEPLAPELHDRDSGVAVHVDLSQRQHQGDPFSGHSRDAAHLCHCLHLHVGGLPTRGDIQAVAVPASLEPPFDERLPVSAQRSAVFRPPIA